MSDHVSERSGVVDIEDEGTKQQPTSGLRKLPRGPMVPAFRVNPKEFKRELSNK